ncbi:Oidioi.mRNA.OKI2018_I69.PAR.g10436.t1.cds [Oikopleura dioica]|uniref:Oidioi.mRNA.OKI2018_I69.PAR.g10436.t1.cds n=1 Tax=Oikopleura dioica TaxID=34765 RepID=A0ABN7RQJ8_OIKDI|nr:Oidioi.mRNA.OKI2018_I69.PAR.g10436.t1.cds [Oikopleura dioica]
MPRLNSRGDITDETQCDNCNCGPAQLVEDFKFAANYFQKRRSGKYAALGETADMGVYSKRIIFGVCVVLVVSIILGGNFIKIM